MRSICLSIVLYLSIFLSFFLLQLYKSNPTSSFKSFFTNQILYKSKYVVVDLREWDLNCPRLKFATSESSYFDMGVDCERPFSMLFLASRSGSSLIIQPDTSWFLYDKK